jgi:DNA processing protein
MSFRSKTLSVTEYIQSQLKLNHTSLEQYLKDISTSKDYLFDFACATWSLICEPGDMIAGYLRDQLGTEQALVKIVGGSNVEEILSMLGGEYSELPSFRVTLASSLTNWRRRTTQSDVFHSLLKLRELGGKLVTIRSPHWPNQLNDLGYAAPAALWVLGNFELLGQVDQSVAVVGSRVSSDYGKAVAHDVVKNLVSMDKSIISGGAIGIDAIAHNTALILGAKTIAIMAGGLDRLYPMQNIELFNRIRTQGALVSEVPPGVSPTKWRFLQRNRLIAALSEATVVIEAGVRSGTINTVGHANELGRPVGAVPGPINSARSAGCHELIKSGKAQLISIPADLKELCGDREYFEKPFTSLSHWEVRALDSLGDEPLTLEQIAKTSGLTIYEAETGLRQLAQSGLAAAMSNGWAKC